VSWDAERQRIIDRYDRRLNDHGAGRAALAVGPEERHHLRFAMLCEIGINNGDHVLDLGCGLGDFRSFAIERGLDIRYTGADLNPSLLAHAKSRHPDAEFLLADALCDELPAVDWIVSSTAFNLRLVSTDNYDTIEAILARTFPRARKGLAIDFLSSFADFQHPDAFHYDPSRLFTFAKTLTKRVTLRHDYPLFEFMLYLYPDFTGWRDA
jgi:SAM-dependent methyltransferase